MSDAARFPSAQFLAEHQHFVERLALALARDEASALDLVQETWLAALSSGTQSIARPRAWLATAMRRRASNLARSESVRREHEARSARDQARDEARDEALEDELLHDRVAFQHSVVAAVLALEEPYRTVVMLRYFQGLSPAAIARRRKLPASTVRSQLARAHAQLRERLEERQGGREAWCLALAGFLERSKPGSFSAPALAVAAGACVLTGAVVAVSVWRLRAPRAPIESGETGEAVASASTPAGSSPRLVEPTFEAARAVVVASEVPLRLAAFEEGPSSAALGAKSLEELCDMLSRVEDELRPRLLTPPADVVAAWRAQHEDSGMEHARVLDRARFTEFASEIVGLRGGGAVYSFVTREQSYDDDPTIGLDHGTFTTTFFSTSRAVVLDLGERDPARLPADLEPEQAETFAVLASGPALPASEGDERLKRLLDERRSIKSPLQLQHTYLLRSVSPHEHDLLAVFVPIHEDAFGVTLAWRVLRTWPVPDPRTEPRARTPRKTLAPEAWTAAMSTDGLLLLLGRIRVLTTGRLLAIPDELRARRPDRPVARVLRDFFGTRYVNVQGGGVFFNFRAQSNDCQQDPDVMLQGEDLSALSTPQHPALILDLGAVSALAVDAAFTPPQDERSRAAWELAWNFEWRPESSEVPPELAPARYRPFADFSGGAPVRAVVGHAYLVRKLVPGVRDQLVAFEILAEDERGIFITWRVLRTWPI